MAPFGRNTEDSNWISIADMMTALMVIFMFIAINFIVQVVEHTFVQEDIYNKLQVVLSEEIENQEIKLGPDGSIRFSMNSGQELFVEAECEPTPEFKKILANFLPKYWGVIKSDTNNLDYIKEIRIEGHADSKRYFKNGDTAKTAEISFRNNLDLSQCRSAHVLRFLREQPIYLDVDSAEKERMDFLFTAIGFSNSRTINEVGLYTYIDSLKVVHDTLSRRVEFRIVTSNEKLTKQLIDFNEN